MARGVVATEGGRAGGRRGAGAAGRVLRWVVAVAALVLGVLLLASPVRSLGLLVVVAAVGLVLVGLDELGAGRTHGRLDGRVLGVLLLVLAVVLLLWPGPSLRAVAVAVGLALVAGGVLRAVRALRGGGDERVASVLEGAAAVLLGLAALVWPDVTLLVVSVVLGVRLVLLGVTRIVRLLSGRDGTAPTGGAPDGRRPWWRRWLRTAGAVAALLAALAVLVVGVLLRGGSESPDAFYDPPPDVPAEPGVLLSSEPWDTRLPDGADGYRVLYTTTRGDGSPAVGSGLVVVPSGAADGPLPVVAWAHGTTGVARHCAPSLLPDPWEAGAAPALQEVVDAGWAFVAPDYTGLGTEGPHGYLVGEDAGRAVLDAVRAARGLDTVQLADDAVVWGHSQGGGAALWTGQLAPSYAPDAGVGAVAAMAPASDLPGLVGNLDDLPGGSIFASYVLVGFADTYDDVRLEDYVVPGGRPVVEEVAARCLRDRGVFVSAAESFVLSDEFWSTDAATGPLGARLAENVPAAGLEVPLLLAQGEADPLVLPSAQDGYAELLCGTGTLVDYRTYPGRDHVGVVAADSPLVPELLAWTQERFDGVEASSTC